jgi:hypothetical protein
MRRSPLADLFNGVTWVLALAGWALVIWVFFL